MGALGSRLHACSLMFARDFSTPTCFFSCPLSITKKEEEEEEDREEKEEEEKEEDEEKKTKLCLSSLPFSSIAEVDARNLNARSMLFCSHSVPVLTSIWHTVTAQ